MKKIVLAMLVVCAFLTEGCNKTTLFNSVVTVTQVRNSVMNALGEEYRAGRVNAETDKWIMDADKAYRDAALVAEQALTLYKETGSGDPVAILGAVKITVTNLINILAGFQNTDKLSANLEKATKL